jgi:hypothetical protein
MALFDRRILKGKLPIAGALATTLALPLAAWAQAPLNQIPQPPSDLPPPHGPLFAYAIFNWLFVAAVVAYLLWAAWRTRSVFPLAFLAGGALAGIVEPVFDGNIHVWFNHPPGDPASWHVYNVPYPWYVIPGNATLAGPTYFIYERLRRGAGARELWSYFFICWAYDGFLELPGTVMGAYVYFGPHPFTIANWPIWIGALAGLGLPLAAYTAYVMRDLMSGVSLWLGFAILMPVVIYGCEVISWPMWDMLNAGQSVPVTRIAALVSLALMGIAYHVLVLAYGRARAIQEIAAPNGASIG